MHIRNYRSKAHKTQRVYATTRYRATDNDNCHSRGDALAKCQCHPAVCGKQGH